MEIKRLEKSMFEQAKNLEFEKAAQTRDQLARLRAQVFGAGQASAGAAPSEKAA
jgi:excinuclease ABC subunit B